ncbi:MAG: regulatory protein RecX [Bacteroidetes bacterium]|nr:regulatory protein RecX [Bacteroidota bacterium]
MQENCIPLEYLNTYLKTEQYCAVQERCAFDVKRKLAQQKIPSEITEQIIRELHEKNFINNDRYCEAFTNDHFRLKKWGVLKIKSALNAKFLPSQSIKNALGKIDKQTYLANLNYLINRKKRELSFEKDPIKKKARLTRYLASNGYELELIFDLIN